MSNMIAYRNSRTPSLFPEEHLFDEFMRPFFRAASRPAFRVDVKENENEYLLEAELPGVNRDSIDVNVDDGVLTIKAVWNESKNANDEGNGYIISERRCGEVARSFSVDNIVEDGITASYADGILTLALPKAVPAKKEPRRIEIH